MGGYRYCERHSVGSCCLHRFAKPGADSTVCDLLDTLILHSTGALVSSFQRNFQSGHHHLQLTDILMIRKRNQAMNLTTARRSTSRSGRFLGALLERGQLHERIRRRQRKIPPGQRQRQLLVDARAGVPESCQQHLAVKIRHVMEQGAYSRSQ